MLFLKSDVHAVHISTRISITQTNMSELMIQVLGFDCRESYHGEIDSHKQLLKSFRVSG